MKIFRILLVLSLGCTLLNTHAFANEEAAADPASAAVQPGFAYHALDPDIITNYLGDGKTLGYVRVTVELMAENAADLKLLPILVCRGISMFPVWQEYCPASNLFSSL